MNLDVMAVIADESQPSKTVHEETDARARGPDHLSQGFLADLGDKRFRLALIAIVRQQQQQPRQPPLAGIEQLLDEVGLDPYGPVQDMVYEHLCKFWLFLDHADHRGLFETLHLR